MDCGGKRSATPLWLYLEHFCARDATLRLQPGAAAPHTAQVRLPLSTRNGVPGTNLPDEPEKGRADIQLICDYRIKPIETVEVGEIELAEDEIP